MDDRSEPSAPTLTLLKIRAAASIYGIDRSTFYRHLHDPRWESFVTQIGGGYRIVKERFEAWLAAGGEMQPAPTPRASSVPRLVPQPIPQAPKLAQAPPSKSRLEFRLILPYEERIERAKARRNATFWKKKAAAAPTATSKAAALAKAEAAEAQAEAITTAYEQKYHEERQRRVT